MKKAGRAALFGAALLTACTPAERIVIGAKNFTESDLLAEIVAQQIERRAGVAVERRLHLGGTFVCHEALLAGEIDLYVEYTGTALTAVLKLPPARDPAEARRQVADEYGRLGLRWGPAFGFNNTFAIAVRRGDADRHGLRRVSDLSAVAPQWRAGFGYEFLERGDGFPGLSRVYGLKFAAPPTAMDLGLTYRALAEGKVDVIAGNSTDPQIEVLELVALEDDRGYFPPYEAAPVYRAVLMKRHPALAPALEELGGTIDEAEMRRLNRRADIEHHDIASVAREWLARRLP